MSGPGRPCCQRITRGIARGLLVPMVLTLVARAVVEIVTVVPRSPRLTSRTGVDRTARVCFEHVYAWATA
jgi:hypothetical protein